MPRVTSETIAHVARLARLSLSAEEGARFARQLEQVLEYAESLKALDAEAATSASFQPPGRPRTDQPGAASLSNEQALREAKDHAQGLFRVPRVLPG